MRILGENPQNLLHLRQDDCNWDFAMKAIKIYLFIILYDDYYFVPLQAELLQLKILNESHKNSPRLRRGDYNWDSVMTAIKIYLFIILYDDY